MLTRAIHGAVTGWNAITLTNSYNNRLQQTQHQAVSPVPLTLLNLSYSYDQGSGLNNGNVISITNNRDLSRSVSYSYDQVNRLASAQTASTWGDAYVYDAWGNLLQKNVIKGTAELMSLIVNNKNQVTSPAFTYDAAGNVTWDTSHALSYNAEGHMSPVSGTSYTYDCDGRRVLKSDGTVYWVDDQLRPISVGTTSGSITRDYIFVGSQRIAMVPLSSGNPYYYLSDRLGSTSVIASGDGKTIQWDADYFPFGSLQQIFTNTVGNDYEFTGYENDSETGYNYANARFDAGRWGRFLSPDPYLGSIDVTNPQSFNRYAYVMNRPTFLRDPLGLEGTGMNGEGPCDDPLNNCFVPDEYAPIDPAFDDREFCNALSPCLNVTVNESLLPDVITGEAQLAPPSPSFDDGFGDLLNGGPLGFNVAGFGGGGGGIPGHPGSFMSPNNLFDCTNTGHIMILNHAVCFYACTPETLTFWEARFTFGDATFQELQDACPSFAASQGGIVKSCAHTLKIDMTGYEPNRYYPSINIVPDSCKGVIIQ